MMMFKMYVSVSLCMFGVLKDVLMFKASATVDCESFGLLMTLVIWLQMLRKPVPYVLSVYKPRS